MNISLTEAQLIKRCAAGERAAQKVLYDLYVDDMMRLCLRYIPSSEDAREALMDGFYNCFERIDSFQYRGEGSLKAWLKKIVVNSCLMRLRKRVNIMVEELTSEDEIGVDNMMLEALSAKEILTIIQKLPDGYRTVFNLYFFENATHKEIAQALGVSENTSKSQLAKAKASLQQMLSAYY